MRPSASRSQTVGAQVTTAAMRRVATSTSGPLTLVVGERLRVLVGGYSLLWRVPGEANQAFGCAEHGLLDRAYGPLATIDDVITTRSIVP